MLNFRSETCLFSHSRSRCKVYEAPSFGHWQGRRLHSQDTIHSFPLLFKHREMVRLVESEGPALFLLIEPRVADSALITYPLISISTKISSSVRLGSFDSCQASALFFCSVFYSPASVLLCLSHRHLYFCVFLIGICTLGSLSSLW